MSGLDGHVLRWEPRNPQMVGVEPELPVGYALERLGWLHFEQLCAALLELEGGVAPLAWGGGSDRCRAVLSGTPLAPPVVSRVGAGAGVGAMRVGEERASGRAARRRRASRSTERPEDLAVATSFVLLTNLDRTAKLETAVRALLGSTGG